jgi:hypothetical protein
MEKQNYMKKETSLRMEERLQARGGVDRRGLSEVIDSPPEKV